MSLTINEIRQKLNKLEQVKSNPELIFKIFNSRVADIRLFQNIIIDDMSINEYFEKCLSKLDVFSENIVICHNDTINIKVHNTIELDKDEFQYNNDIDILSIDLCNHTYFIDTDYVDYIKNVLNTTYTLYTSHLSEFWQNYENYNMSRRFKLAIKSFKEGNRLHIKFINFFVNMTISNKKIKTLLDDQYKHIDYKNELNKKQYDKNISRQKLYKEVAPAQIEKIENEQAKIVSYLNYIGYTESTEEY